MDSFLYPVLTIGYLALFIWSFRSFRESFFWGTSWVLFIILALVYDNLILSLGIWLGQSELFEDAEHCPLFASCFADPDAGVCIP